MNIERKGRAGFTLIEVIVAMSIAGLLMAGMFVSWSGALSGKSVEATANEFAAVLRANATSASSTRFFHIVYFTQHDYVVARFAKTVYDPNMPDRVRTVGMLLFEVMNEKDLNQYGDFPVPRVVDRKKFRQVRIVAARYFNGDAIGDDQLPPSMAVVDSEIPKEYLKAVNSSGGQGIPFFLISPDAPNFLGVDVNLDNELDVEGAVKPSYVTFASTRELSRQFTVVISQGIVHPEPGGPRNLSLIPQVRTVGDRFDSQDSTITGP